MIYRIRFRQAGEAREREATVEANSPNEAMVKFRCTADFRPGPAKAGQEVTSVLADEAEEPW